MAEQTNEEAQTQEWIATFEKECELNPTAKKAWQEICEAGLRAWALQLLWGYSGAAVEVVRAMNASRMNATDALDEAIRAEQKAAKRIVNPRSALFRSRAQKKRSKALRAQWPIEDKTAATLREAMSRDSLPEDHPQSLTKARKALVKAAGKRSPLSVSQYFIFLLQGVAECRGVRLGMKQLVALADCADPSRQLDEKNLHRFIKAVPCKKAIISDTKFALSRLSLGS
jgi:hypothetical protein